MSPAELDILLKSLPIGEKADLLALMDELESRKRVSLCQNDFLAFIAAVDPVYKFGTHLKKLGALLMEVEDGAKDRIAVSMAPRFGKSQMISIYYPAWYLGKHPDHQVIVASHTVDLAVDMARKVRNLMKTPEYRKVFPGVEIAADAKAAGKWNTTKGGVVYATGVGGALAGRGAHLIIADDPISEQDIKSGNTSSLDGVYEWFRNGLRTRLMPGGRLAILHCLVGDTQITMGDGSQKPLLDVRPGDMVASYDGGRIRSAKVLLWANQGLDDVYTIALRSGDILRGNERHPLLVNQDGVEKWIKIRDLKPGMLLVSTKGVSVHPTTKQSGGFAKSATTTTWQHGKPPGGFLYALSTKTFHALRRAVQGLGNLRLSRVLVRHAKPENGPGKRTLMQSNTPLGTTVSGKENYAVTRAAGLLRIAEGFALHAGAKTEKPSVRPWGLRTIALRSAVNPTLKCGMGSPGRSMTKCWPTKQGAAIFVMRRHMGAILRPLGQSARWLWTTTIAQVRSVRFYAARAISLLRSATPLSCFNGPLSTLTTTLDEVLSITPSGREEVFDIQVEGTENFLANGVVSHNTRWHSRDLIGRLVKDAALNEDGDQYEVFEFPAILEFDNPAPEADPTSPTFDPDVPKTLQKSLWPEQWSLESLLRTKASMPAWQWNAQYQQNPTAQEAAIIKREHIKWWPHETPPNLEFIVQAYDTALTTKARSDYSVCQTWGVWSTEDGLQNCILLNSARGKWEFPELKKMALQQAKDWNPDSIIVEAKASGQPLIDEMRRSGLFVQDYSPGKGQDKIARVNSISDMFASGQIWFPETGWATGVVEELLAFPAGENDDQVDALSLALIRIRKGGFMKLANDVQDDAPFQARRTSGYY